MDRLLVTSPSSCAGQFAARAAAGFVLVLSIIAAGCGKSPFELAPVTGRLLIDGKPFAGGKVMFAPAQGSDEINVGKPAFGLLDSEGRFVLGTYSEQDGAVVGKHWVTLYSLEDRRAPSDSHVPKFDRIPATQQPLEVSAAGENDFLIELTSTQIRKLAR